MIRGNGRDVARDSSFALQFSPHCFTVKSLVLTFLQCWLCSRPASHTFCICSFNPRITMSWESVPHFREKKTDPGRRGRGIQPRQAGSRITALNYLTLLPFVHVYYCDTGEKLILKYAYIHILCVRVSDFWEWNIPSFYERWNKAFSSSCEHKSYSNNTDVMLISLQNWSTEANNLSLCYNFYQVSLVFAARPPPPIFSLSSPVPVSP